MPRLLLSAFVRAPDNVFELFSPERTPYMKLKRVVAGPEHRLEFHVELRGTQFKTRFLRYWEIAASQADTCKFYFVDDTSVVESFEWREARMRALLMDDIRRLVSDRLRPSIGSMMALAEVMRDRPEFAVEAAERYLLALQGLNQEVVELDRALEGPHDLDFEIPFRVRDLPAVLSTWSNDRATVTCHMEENVRGCFVAAAVVEHVLVPVLDNALESSPRDGVVNVVVSHLAGSKVCFEVADHGRGMTRHELARAQDPFFTTKRGHAGLGLVKAEAALRAVGGYWNFSSVRREGTKVRICVPQIQHEGMIRLKGQT